MELLFRKILIGVKVLKKIAAVVLSLVLIFGLFSVNTFALGGENDYRKVILNAIHNMEQNVDLESYNVQTEDVFSYVDFVFNQYPEYYYISNIGSSVKPNGEMVTLYLDYRIDKEEMLERRAFIDDAVKPILDDVGKNWSDAQKALRVHDWLVANFMYDYRLFEQPGTENHDIYGFLKDKMGVCQSYAYTYMYILRQLDVDAYYVVSDTDNHGWNVVNIDGNWYHVDVTHDDPIIGYTYRYDYMGAVRHNKFLLSDNEILDDGKHDDFYIPEVNGITCGEYTGNAIWRNAVSAFQEIDGNWYYLDNSGNAGGLMVTKDFNNSERIMEIGRYVSDWNKYGWAIGSRTYSTYYTGLFEYDGCLYFTDSTKMYAYDAERNNVRTLPASLSDDMYYFGLDMDGKTLNYLYSSGEITKDVVRDSYTLSDNHYISGDANGDGIVDARDLAIQKLYLANSYSGEITDGADYNSDGVIDALDLASMKLFLAGASQ